MTKQDDYNDNYNSERAPQEAHRTVQEDVQDASNYATIGGLGENQTANAQPIDVVRTNISKKKLHQPTTTKSDSNNMGQTATPRNHPNLTSGAMQTPIGALDELAMGEDVIDGNVRQNDKGRRIVINHDRNSLLTDFGKETLKDRYLVGNETFQDLFARVSLYYSDDSAHAQRLYDYMSQLWFMPATPILSNGGTERGLPISCFLNEATDSLKGIVDLWNENVWLAARGGGIGSYWGNLRSMNEQVSLSGKTSGIVPFIKVMESITHAISQGSIRRGSAAIYLPVWHPEIEEFTEIRRTTGADPVRRAPNLHHGVVINDEFMRAVERDDLWALKSPKDDKIITRVKARDIWIKILTARVEMGEPYILNIDHIARAQPEHHKLAGLQVKTSNLCSEITLPTGIDHLGKMRTAVCCLSSLNLETYDQWKNDEMIVEDVLRFLDNVLQDFIDNAPPEFANAKYSAMRERSVGLGVMGFHSFLQSKMIPWESATAKAYNKKIFKDIKEKADQASHKLADERGPCMDAAEFGFNERFSHKIAIAPTASISIITGGTSPGIEPIVANSFTHKTLSGSFTVRNRHLEKLFKEKGRNDPELWSRITMNAGSVQDLDFLTPDEKLVFKTGHEINQETLVIFAADRTPYVCQAQSLNLFLRPDVHKKDLHHIHYLAWKLGVKSLYYCRSQAIKRAEKRHDLMGSVLEAAAENGLLDTPRTQTNAPTANPNDGEVCEVC
ncbi:MAG: ribonucleoside-diphosphate reductase subunit alpha, partial [Hydrotalea sp.]|nr:ribonucleoside-diphosphate reductase subunit alpha [Hydrotalea sp.]